MSKPRRERATSPAPHIRVRRHPTQARAKQTVDLILETAARLLEEMSIDSFNTNVLAKRAGVPVRSVYRYYPNKLAVIAALWTKLVNEWDPLLAPCLDQLADPAHDLHSAWKSLMTAYIQWLSSRRGAWAVRNAVHAVAELNSEEQAAEEWFVSRIAKALERRGITLPHNRLRIVCAVWFRASNAIIHTEFVHQGYPRKAVVEETERLVNSYLESYRDYFPR